MPGVLDSFKELVWPETLGTAIGIAGHYLSRGIDAAQGWEKPFKRSQDYVALGMLFGSAYAHSRVKPSLVLGHRLLLRHLLRRGPSPEKCGPLLWTRSSLPSLRPKHSSTGGEI